MLEITEQDLDTCNTLGLSARARMLRVRERGVLPELSHQVRQGEELFVLGSGSNVVMSARPHRLVAKMELYGVQLLAQESDAWIVEAQAGEPWHRFVDDCLAQGWSGLENLALIPGDCRRCARAEYWRLWSGAGAARAQRAGLGYAGGAADRAEPGAMRFEYRDSVFKRSEPGRWLILAVRFRLPRVWRPVLDYPDLARHPLLQGAEVSARRVFDAVCEIRRRKLPDPAVLGNAGSFFKNPLVSAQVAEDLRTRFSGLVSYPQSDGRAKLAAGWLIDRWLERAPVGAVGMHAQQALVLVNHGGASADDVRRLADAVREDVAARFGVRLEQEPVVLD